MLVVGEKDSLDIVTGNDVDEILFVVEIIDGQVGQTVGFVGFPVIVESGYLVLFAVAHPGLERNAPVVHAVNQQPAVALRDFGNDDIVSQHHAHTHTYQHHRGHQHVQQAPIRSCRSVSIMPNTTTAIRSSFTAEAATRRHNS